MSCGCGSSICGVVLRRQEHALVLAERVLEGADGRRPPDDERHHHVREDDQVPQRERWGGFRRLPLAWPSPSSVIGWALFSTTSRVITHSRIFFWPGSVYMSSSIRSSMIIRRPRAPILRSIAPLGDRLERVVGEPQLDVLVLEQLLVLTRDRVLRLRQDLDQRRLVELVQRAHDRQAADELGDQAVLDRGPRARAARACAPRSRGRMRLDVGLEPHRLLADPPLDDLLEARRTRRRR